MTDRGGCDAPGCEVCALATDLAEERTLTGRLRAENEALKAGPPENSGYTIYEWQKAEIGRLRAETERLRRRVVELRAENERAESIVNAAVVRAQRLETSLLILADRLERDRREPDKVLCYVLDMRRAAQTAGASDESRVPAFPCVFCGAGCSGRYDAEGHREGYCLKCGKTQPPLPSREFGASDSVSPTANPPQTSEATE